jgi:hypothetical protein
MRGYDPRYYLTAHWSKSERDIVYSHPDHGWNSRLVHMFFSCQFREFGDPNKYMKSFLDELEARGFDIETLKFSIRKKKDWKPQSEREDTWPIITVTPGPTETK